MSLNLVPGSIYRVWVSFAKNKKRVWASVETNRLINYLVRIGSMSKYLNVF